MTKGCAPVLYEWEPDHGGSIVGEPAVPTPERRVAVVTGANHGIGAATAVALAAAGVDVLVTYLRFDDEVDPGLPGGLRRRAGRAAPSDVLAAIDRASRAGPSPRGRPHRAGRAGRGRSTRPSGGSARCRSSSTTPAGGRPTRSRRHRPIASARTLASVSPATIERNLGVDARAGGPADRRAGPPPRRPRRDVGPHRRADVGRPERLPAGGLLRRGQGGARELHDVGGRRAGPVRHHGQRRPPAGHRHRLGHRRRPGVRRRSRSSSTTWPSRPRSAAVIAWLCSDAAWLVTGNVLRLR